VGNASPVEIRLSIERLDPPDRFYIIYLAEIALSGCKVRMPQKDCTDDSYLSAGRTGSGKKLNFYTLLLS
jgi:hypothetical protein